MAPTTEWFRNTGDATIAAKLTEIWKQQKLDDAILDIPIKYDNLPTSIAIAIQLRNTNKLTESDENDVFPIMMRHLLKLREAAEGFGDLTTRLRFRRILVLFEEMAKGIKEREVKALRNRMLKDDEDLTKTLEGPVKQNSEESDWEDATFDTNGRPGDASKALKITIKGEIDDKESSYTDTKAKKSDITDDDWVMVQDGRGDARPAVADGERESHGLGKVLKTFTGLMRG